MQPTILKASGSSSSGTYLNYFYLRDRLGSVRGATSDTGSVIQNSDYLPYGPPTPEQPAATDPDFGFTGHLKCPFTGLTLAPYRVLGYANWLSRDPIGENGGVNLYGYAANDPANQVDPYGLCWWSVFDWGLTVADVKATYETLNDPGASAWDKGLSLGMTVGGALLPGGGLAAATRAAKSVGGASDEMVTVFRGVHAEHPQLANAVQGKAVPWGGHSNPVLHNMGDNASVFTSWTTDYSTSVNFATGNGPGGVVLRQTVPRSSLIRSPDNFLESEVLRRGPIDGATPIILSK